MLRSRSCAPHDGARYLASGDELVRNVWSVGHQTARLNVLPITVHRRQSRAHSQDVDATPVGIHERVRTNIKGIRAVLERLEGGGDVLRPPDFGCSDLKAERAGRCLGLAHVQHGGGIADIDHDRQPAKIRYHFAQEFEFLANSIRLQPCRRRSTSRREETHNDPLHMLVCT
jgi:hypothetical protein